MIHKVLSALIYFLLFFSLGCSKKVEGPVRIKVDEIIKALGPVKEVKKTDPQAVSFKPEYYGEGLIADSFKVLSYKELSFLIIEFESEELAHAEALRLKQYYHKNWLFDEVNGEPSLEDLIIHKLQAINPSLKVQRVPKNLPKEEMNHGAPGKAAPSSGH